jgi:hypothetical protein
MMDDLTNQAIDLLFEHNTVVQDRVINPMKKKAMPYLLTGVTFNILLLLLVMYLVITVYKLNKLIHA